MSPVLLEPGANPFADSVVRGSSLERAGLRFWQDLAVGEFLRDRVPDYFGFLRLRSYVAVLQFEVDSYPAGFAFEQGLRPRQQCGLTQSASAVDDLGTVPSQNIGEFVLPAVEHFLSDDRSFLADVGVNEGEWQRNHHRGR